MSRGPLAITSDRTALYRIYGDADELLYVGISKDFGRRWKEHAKAQPWWAGNHELTVSWYDSRPEAAAAEQAAIRDEEPKYNKRRSAAVQRPSRRPVKHSPRRAERRNMPTESCLERQMPCQRRDAPNGCFGTNGIGYSCLLAESVTGSEARDT